MLALEGLDDGDEFVQELLVIRRPKRSIMALLGLL